MNMRLLILLFATSLWAQVPEGIPHDLAKQRAQQISDVRYSLNFNLKPHTPSASGREELKFHLNAAAPLLLDFREGTVADLKVNGHEAPSAIERGHIALPSNLLRAGENVVTMALTAPIAPAGKAITRFEDKDDGSEYIYTLCAPMDADLA